MMLKDFILKKKILRFLGKDNKRTLFLVNIKKDLPAASELIRDVAEGRENIMSVFFNIEMPSCLKGINSEKSLSEDYLNAHDFQEMDEYVFKDIARNWFLSYDEARKQLEYSGIKLGSLVEYEFGFFLIPLIKNMEVARRAVQSHKPERIVSIEDTGQLNPVVKLIAEELKIPALILSYDSMLSSLSNLTTILSVTVTSSLSYIMDSYMRPKVLKSERVNECICVDTGIYDSLVSSGKAGRFIQLFFSNDFRARYKIFKKGEIYFPFYLFSSKKLTKQWLDKWRKLKTDSSFQERFNYKQIIYWPLVEKKFAHFFKDSFPRIIMNIELLKEFHRKREIKVIVLRADLRESEKTAVITAKNIDIPTLMVQHGILGEINGHEAIYCDKVAAWGRMSIEWYKNFGNPPDKCLVTGNPLFDALFKKIQGRGKDASRTCCAGLNEEMGLHDLIKMSEFVINVESTVGLETMILDKPLININLTKRRDLVSYVETGAAQGAYKPEEISIAINRLLEDEIVKKRMEEARKIFISDYAYRIDGLSGKRVLDLIEKMAGGNEG